MKKSNPLHFFIFFTLVCGAAQAQYVQPRLVLGGDAALFRISLGNFEQVYTSRWGESYAAFAGIRLFAGNYLMLKAQSFEQQGREGTHPVSGRDLTGATWRQKWYNIGLRVHPPLVRKWQSYYGFGVALFDADEEPGLSVFTAAGQEKEQGRGSGFYLELGIEYFPAQRLAGYFEMGISSGGIRGKSGHESFSIGGFRFALGISWWPI